jgi:hypothetical protein
MTSGEYVKIALVLRVPTWLLVSFEKSGVYLIWRSETSSSAHGTEVYTRKTRIRSLSDLSVIGKKSNRDKHISTLSPPHGIPTEFP